MILVPIPEAALNEQEQRDLVEPQLMLERLQREEREAQLVIMSALESC